MAVKIGITNEKGGIGKTASSVNIGGILAEKGYKVLIIDLDPQAFATIYFDKYNDKHFSILEVMKKNASPEETIITDLIEELPSLHLLPSKITFDQINVHLMTLPRRQEYTLKNSIRPIEDYYDYIIFDCPANEDKIKQNVYTYADYLLLPIKLDGYAVKAIMRMAEIVKEIKEEVNPDLDVLGIMLTAVEINNDTKASYEEVKKIHTIPIYQSNVRKNVAISNGINLHLPINLYNRKCNGYDDYLTITESIIEQTKYNLL